MFIVKFSPYHILSTDMECLSVLYWNFYSTELLWKSEFVLFIHTLKEV